MKRFIAAAAFILLFAGCATNNQVSTGGINGQGTPATVQDQTPAEAAAVKEDSPRVSGTGKGSTTRSMKTKAIVAHARQKQEASRKTKPQPYSLEVKVNDDDDITTLLSTNYNQNFDIPIVFNDAVKYYIKWFSEDKKKVFANWLKRSRLYVPIITEILREKNMPEDLVYLAMIESGFNPKAYSHAKASGPWQFIYSTGGRYGLEVDYWVDERRDPEKSTVAAAKYLKDLFDQFGCWYLAAASYNAGEGRIGRLVQKHNTNDFWELYKYNTLPRETRNYIPQLIAAAIIAKDPAKFGFGSITYDPPVRFAEVKVPAATPIAAIARASNRDMDTIRMCNPEILRGITPPGKSDYMVKLPSDVDRQAFTERLETELEKLPSVKSVITYKVRKKDSMARIVKKYNVSERDLVLVNSSDDDLKIKPGMVIAIPRFSGGSERYTALAKAVTQDPPAVERSKAKRKSDDDSPVKALSSRAVAKKSEPAVVRPEKEIKARPVKAFHVVKRGETLSEISDRYGIDEASLRSANKLKGNRVYPNMKIRLVSHVEPKKARVAAKSTKKVLYHTVKKGETLTSISEKYGIDVDDLKTANKLKGNKITTRAKLKIVKEG
ncbi:MAG: Membrane-bound lytic murein transglycosylase D precursor [Syntrophorhabdus sp. PtaB.Bin047]|nr:MAG: Membrane-bound lytic murein transglycosylase D precursor [Syntrophorhabdus sp. PtaB.Bin047]